MNERETEVDQFDLSIPRHKEVCGLEIAVQDALAVGMSETFERLRKDGDGGLGAETLTASKHRIDIAPIDELHHHKEAISFMKKVVQGDEVGVRESGHRTGFLDESLSQSCVAFKLWREGFDRDRLVGENVGRLENLSHPTLTDGLLKNVVLSDALAGLEIFLGALLARNLLDQGIDGAPRLFF
jgi:hypothetical protein